MLKKYTSNRPIGGIRDGAGIGYIIIPRDKDKKAYIQSCLRTGTISIVLESGGIIDNVLVSKSSMNQLDFPEGYDDLGSLVIWINQPRKNQPIVIGTLSKNNEFVDFNKEASVLRRNNKNYVGEVIVDANKGVIIINSSSAKDTGGDIYIISLNKKKDSKLYINISGDINIKSSNLNIENSNKVILTVKDKSKDDKITSIAYEKEVGFSYKDEFNNEVILNEDNVQIKPNKLLKIGDGNEPMLLGDTFKKTFEDFTDALIKLAGYCAAIQVGTAMGTSTVPTNASQFTQIAQDLTQLRADYKDFQSKQSSLD